MKHGAERKLLVEEFETLMNNAYRFLGVCCPPEVALFVFEQEDKDKDGFLTYVEYFNVIQKYVCKMTSSYYLI